MAEQLGAGGAPGAAAGPDWAEQSRRTSAPDWLSGDAEPTQAAPARPVSSSAPSSETPAAAPAPFPTRPVATRSKGGDEPSDDDEDLASSGAVGQSVIENVLGGTVIEINDEPVA